MFVERIKEIQATMDADVSIIDTTPSSMLIDNYFTLPDTQYLLDTAPKLTESISLPSGEIYLLSPYKDDVITTFSKHIAFMLNYPVTHLSYIEMYKISKGQQLILDTHDIERIQESPVANSPWGKIASQACITMTEGGIFNANGLLFSTPYRLFAIEKVDQNTKEQYNSVLGYKAVDQDVWMINFKFAENPRELI
jgi:hypothetical protein|tara:strand:+ start:109 stop:693 length:585 start_codon:yes stop_codon:yes gene_type:complete